MSPAFRAICLRGANCFRFESGPCLYEYVCQIWLRSDGRVENGGIQTDRETKGHCSIVEAARVVSLNNITRKRLKWCRYVMRREEKH